MPETYRRIVMLIGLNRETRSAFAKKLRALGWAVVQGHPSNPLVVEELVRFIKSGREVVLDSSNTQRKEWHQWFQFVEDFFKDRPLGWQLYWIGLLTDGPPTMREMSKRRPDAPQIAMPKLEEGFNKILSLRDLPCDPSLYFASASAPRCKDHSVGGSHPEPDRFSWNTSVQRRRLDEGDMVLLFDLNGTLTSHTSQRRSTGQNKLRPGTEHLKKLKGRFRLGIFTSSTYRTVDKVLSMFRAHLGEHLFDPQLIFFRDHTKPVGKSLQRNHGLKPWDTIKPLGQLFTDVQRVVLFDDDPWKAVRGEEENMVVVPCWKSEDPHDAVLQNLVHHVQNLLGSVSAHADLRKVTEQLTSALQPGAPRGKNHAVPFPQSSRRRNRTAQRW